DVAAAHSDASGAEHANRVLHAGAVRKRQGESADGPAAARDLRVADRLVAKGRRGPKSAQRIIAFGTVEGGLPGGRMPRGAFRMTSAGAPFAIWCAPESRSGSPCRCPGTRPAVFFERYNIVSESDFKDAARKVDAAKGKLATTAES